MPFAIPKLYLMIGAAVVIALFLAWVWRIDSLRAQHLKERDAERAAAVLFADRVKLTSETIVAKALANKSRVEAAQANVTQENDREIRSRIAAAVNAVRLRSAGGTNTSGGGNPVSGPANAASGASGASEAPIVLSTDDLTSCVEAVVKAEGWQSWHKAVVAIER